MGIVVGIAGVSRAGKGTLSRKIKEWYQGKNVQILDMDKFVLPEEEIPRIRGEVDWEVPESVDYTRLATTIAELKPVTDLVIVEGILIFNDQKLLALYDKKIIVEIDYETFLARKKKDVRWKFPEWYIDHVWTSYIIHGSNNTEGALKVRGDQHFDLQLITKFIGIS